MSTPDRFLFKEAQLPPEAFDYHRYMEMGLSKAEAKHEVQRAKLQRVVLSTTYQVNIVEVPVPAFGLVMTWLSIKRRNKDVIHDWRELQRIKNAICGPEREGVELYPSESRLVDTANQYHLWVLPSGHRFPFGYPDRLVMTSEQAAAVGARQREHEAARNLAAAGGSDPDAETYEENRERETGNHA